MRRGFSMLTAISILVLMASVAAFIMNISSKMVQETTAQYQREQAMLLSRSYTEYAILAVTANDQSQSSCLKKITGTAFESEMGDYAYQVEVNIQYIGNDVNTNCTKLNSGDIETDKSPLTIVVDSVVRYPDPSYPDPTTAPKISYHRRTTQKI